MARSDATARDLRHQLHQHQQAIETMAEGLCMFDADQRLVLANSKYAQIYGLPERLLEGGTPHADISRYRVAHGLKMVGTLQSFMERHQSITTRVPNGVTLVQLHTGALISIHHENLSDGGWVSTHWDVTEDLERVVVLEKREHEMKRHNLRFDAAVNNMAQGLCMFDADRRLVICNAPFAELYGADRKADQAGHPARRHPEIPAQSRARWQRRPAGLPRGAR